MQNSKLMTLEQSVMAKAQELQQLAEENESLKTKVGLSCAAPAYRREGGVRARAAAAALGAAISTSW